MTGADLPRGREKSGRGHTNSILLISCVAKTHIIARRAHLLWISNLCYFGNTGYELLVVWKGADLPP